MRVPNYENRSEYFELFTRKDEFGIPKINVCPHNLYEWFEDEVNEYAEQYAKQSLIEELSYLECFIQGADEDDIARYLQLRIDELKQE